MNLQETKAYIRARIIDEYGSLRAFDRFHKLFETYTSNMLWGAKASIPNWILVEFGLRKQVTFEFITPAPGSTESKDTPS